MANKSRVDLVEQAAKNLNILPPGTTLAAEDSTTIDGYVDGVLEELSGREIVTIPDPDDIEPRHFYALAICLADACKYEFAAGMAFDVATAEAKLRHMERSGPSYETMQGTYF
jgi:hypothetical protein